MNSNKIKVLWIEDQSGSNICKPFILQAQLKNIELVSYPDWESGKKYLEDNKDEISAIVLDCYCKLNNESGESSKFLTNVIAEIDSMTEKYGKLFPWFVLSAGSKDDFRSIIELSLTDKREKWDKDWGKVYYSKLNEDDDLSHLIEHIQKASTFDKDYTLREMYQNAISVLESTNFDNNAVSLLLKILKPLHFMEERSSFDATLHYNQIRQLLEIIFQACYRQNLLPRECIKEGKINLWESSNYLSGKNLKYSAVRYGGNRERVLPEHYSKIIQQILFMSNEMSHAPKSQYQELTECEKKSLRDYFKETSTTFFLYGYALQICDIIIYLNNFFNTHSKEDNRAKINRSWLKSHNPRSINNK